MLQPVVRRTWAHKGETPIHYSWDRHDRLSTIAAITISPQRQRFGLCFDIHSHNIRFDDVMVFLMELHRSLRRMFILVLDRYSAHRKAVRLSQERHPDWFEVEWLPAYASDLNPVEMIWNHTKYGDLANFLPDDVHHLREVVTGSLDNARSQAHLLRAFFRHADLEL